MSIIIIKNTPYFLRTHLLPVVVVANSWDGIFLALLLVVVVLQWAIPKRDCDGFDPAADADGRWTRIHIVFEISLLFDDSMLMAIIFGLDFVCTICVTLLIVVVVVFFVVSGLFALMSCESLSLSRWLVLRWWWFTIERGPCVVVSRCIVWNCTIHCNIAIPGFFFGSI